MKINSFWKIKNFFIVLSFFYCFYNAFLKFDNPTWLASSFGFIAGIILIMIGMCILHDASHFGIFAKASWKNEMISRITTAGVLWH